MSSRKSGIQDQLVKVSDGAYYPVNRGYWISFENARVGSTAQNKVYFHGFITAFKDMFKPEWNEETVFGRTEPIGIYKGISRRLSFSFDAPAATIDEGELNLNKVEGLVEMLYPSYHTIQGDYKVLSQSPLVRIKFANLISTQPVMAAGGTGPLPNSQTALLGYITSFDYDLNLGKDSGVFDHASGKIYPRVINFNIDFTVLNEKMLGYDDVSNTFESAPGWLYGGTPIHSSLDGIDGAKKDVQFGSAIDGLSGDLSEEVQPAFNRREDENAGEPSPASTAPKGGSDETADALNAGIDATSPEAGGPEKRRLPGRIADSVKAAGKREIDKQKEAIRERTTVKDIVQETRIGLTMMTINRAERRIDRVSESMKPRDKREVTFNKILMSDNVKGRE